MDVDFLQKLLSREISDEEREMLCEIAYGMPFSECIGEIRRDDFTNGLNSGKYKILSIGPTDEKLDSVEIRFINDMYFEEPNSFLYQSAERCVEPDIFGIGSAFRYARELVEYCTEFHKAEIDDAMTAALRKWAEKYGISLGGLIEIIKTKDRRNGGKKKKNDRWRTSA